MNNLTYVKGQSNTYEAEIMQDIHLNKEKLRLGDIPLIVISGENKSVPKGDEHWSSEQLVKHKDSLQKDLLNLSTNSKKIITKKSGHNVYIDEPNIVAKAIMRLIK